ncbi:MAG: hypothetical protein E6G14_02250 [Actinobacteria bacterium]|nr:MAG: hypothetical protein E6G14_02250 [Actinomycetota bacterium]
MLKKLNTGAQVILGAGVLFLIFSFFNWYEVKHTSLGESMWHGVGFIAGLLLIVILAWEGLKAANINIQIGISSTMVTFGFSLLLFLFTLIRVVSKPGGGFADSIISRTIWLWLGFILAIVIVGGAWLNMQAAGESLADVKAKISSMTSSSGSGGASAADTSAAPAAPAPAPTPAPPPPAPEPPAAEPTSGDDEPAA